MPERVPTAFISYSWDDDAHKEWVHDLATTLRARGVDVTLDQWHAVPGDQLPEFMERAIRSNDFVLVICTPKYKAKSDDRVGGAGYEGDVMTGEILGSRNLPADQRIRVNRKFVPVLRAGEWATSLPSSMAGKYGIDLRGDPYDDEQFTDLLETLHGQRRNPPPLGANPFSAPTPQSPTPPSQASSVPAVPAASAEGPVADVNEIRILNVIVDEVTSPRADGTRGSALYAIPLRLSDYPSAEWSRIFTSTWDRPPSFTTMHRPGIARVQGNRIVLDGTNH
jgi:hypothetical protein